MKDKIKILIAEDRQTDMELIVRELKRFGLNFIYHSVDNEKDFIETLKSFEPEIVLTDYMMPQFTGMQALKLTKRYNPLLPVIVVTGSMNEETAVECMKAGATDYVIKEHLKRLGASVIQAIRSTENEKEKLEAQLKLAEKEKIFRFIAEKANDLIYVYRIKPQAGFEYVSPSSTHITGYTPEEHYADPPTQF